VSSSVRLGEPCAHKLGEVACANRKNLVVEVITRVVQWHCAGTVAITIANENKRSRDGLQKAAEVLRDHHGRSVGVYEVMEERENSASRRTSTKPAAASRHRAPNAIR